MPHRHDAWSVPCAPPSPCRYRRLPLRSRRLMQVLLRRQRVPPGMQTLCVAVWLFSPFTVSISTRGNGEALVTCMLLGMLVCLQQGENAASVAQPPRPEAIPPSISDAMTRNFRHPPAFDAGIIIPCSACRQGGGCRGTVWAGGALAPVPNHLCAAAGAPPGAAAPGRAAERQKQRCHAGSIAAADAERGQPSRRRVWRGCRWGVPGSRRGHVPPVRDALPA